MRLLVTVMAALMVITFTAQALDYEQKPDIVAYVYGSNYFERGDEKNLVVVVFNDAWNEKIEYDDLNEAGFFNGRESMLFTAYDVEISLDGNEYVKVKTPEQRIPALQPMSPLNLNFLVRISENAKAGEYELNLEVSYYQIDELKEMESFMDPLIVPEQISESLIDNKNWTNTTYYVYKYYNRYYELEYVKKTKTIPIKIYIEEKPVSLEVVKVETNNLIGGGKGRITVAVKNTGDKTAKSAYLVLDTPSAIQAQGLSLSQPTSTAYSSTMPAGMPGMPGMAGGMTGMPFPVSTTTSTPSLSSATAAYYVGDLKPGETVNATFYVKLNVRDGGTYPLLIKAVYIDEFGETKESDSTTFGIEVNDAPEITVKDVDSRVYVNAKGEVEVTLVSDTELKDASVKFPADSRCLCSVRSTTLAKLRLERTLKSPSSSKRRVRLSL